MKVSEVIQKLNEMPQDAEVMFSESSGCPECNMDGISFWHDVFDIKYHKKGNWPHEGEKHVVVVN